MKKVYLAANLQDAYVALNWLTLHGVEGRVFNENSQGGLGELPMSAYPEVWVMDDRHADTARQLLARLRSRPADGADSRCGNCGEDNPAGFEVCWSCGASLSPGA